MLPVVVTDDLFSSIRVVSPEILVDARLQKRLQPEVQRGLAPLTIGLGPNFTAGVTTDLIVETSWGDDLGRVLTLSGVGFWECSDRMEPGRAWQDRSTTAYWDIVTHASE